MRIRVGIELIVVRDRSINLYVHKRNLKLSCALFTISHQKAFFFG
jgi:hypothetical protein